MDRLVRFNEFHSSLIDCVEYGQKGSIPVDQQNSQLFNIDPSTGRPTDDLSAIVRSQNKADMERLMKDFQRYDSSFLPDDMSFEQAVRYYQPNSCQLASELAELSEKYADRDYKDAVDKRYKLQMADFRKSILKGDSNSPMVESKS